jgi:hypothetical protein
LLGNVFYHTVNYGLSSNITIHLLLPFFPASLSMPA